MDKKFIAQCKEQPTRSQCYTQDNWLSTIGANLCELGVFVLGAYSKLPRKKPRTNNWIIN